MTDYPHLPDVARRRQVDRLRADLGLNPVPHYVGSELRALGPFVYEELQQYVLAAAESADLPAAACPDEEQRLLSALIAAAEEFAHIVEDRPLPCPTVAAVLGSSVHEVDDPEQWHQTLCSAFQIVREPMRDFWAELPHSRHYATLLDHALTRYVTQLSTSVRKAVQRTHPGLLPAEDARSTLAEMVELRWGNQPAQLCLRISTRSHTEGATATGAPANPASTGGRAPVPALRLTAKDHLATVVQHPVRASRSRNGAAPRISIWVGPITAADVAPTYDAALLLYRLVDAGVAAPPPPELLPLPDFGFLRAHPSEANVQKIAELLRPLTNHPSVHRRVTLAQTLRLRLRIGDACQQLADHLDVRSQTVRNRLGALRDLYDNPSLDFGGDTLATQAALDLVLPLWEREQAEGSSPSASRRNAAAKTRPSTRRRRRT